MTADRHEFVKNNIQPGLLFLVFHTYICLFNFDIYFDIIYLRVPHQVPRCYDFTIVAESARGVSVYFLLYS